MRIKKKEGYIGGRVSIRLETEFNKWTDDNMKSKTDVLEFCISNFLKNASEQKEFVKAFCKNGKHC